MNFVNTNLFRTEMNISQDTPIIALSDIHGDIDALIIALRDCAKIIKSNNTNINKRDIELDKILNLDLNDNADATLFDLNHNLTFSWIGGNTHIVIVGDILDPRRDNATAQIINTQKSSGTRIFRNVNDIYPQSEIKILCFLNKLDEEASLSGGRIIKLIGNHDCMNFINPNQYSSQFSHDSNEIIRYPQGIVPLSREQYFNINNSGFKLFMKRGAGVALRINNNLFMHGQVDPRYTIQVCDGINNWLNSVNYYGEIDITQKMTVNSSYYLFLNGIANPQDSRLLWNREYGNPVNINDRLTNNKGDTFCNTVLQDIKSFLNNPNLPDSDINNIRVIIGHCIQADSTMRNTPNITYQTQTNYGNVVELTPPAIATYPDLVNNHIFGITMECKNIDPDPTFKIYKVDTGISRAFDTQLDYNNTLDLSQRNVHNHESLKRKFLSRVPQVLRIQNNDIRIIRSTLQNTRIHQYRSILEDNIKRDIQNGLLTSDFSIENMAYGGHDKKYKQKYLKYKQKYLSLKKDIS